MSQPMITLANGLKMPNFGFGTWRLHGDNVVEMIYNAIKVGVRHIDCAAVYLNEKEVGAGLKKALDEGLVKREELFITSKIWNTDHNPKRVEPACRKTLSDLGLSYLDLYLIHWPTNWVTNEDAPEPLTRKLDADGVTILDDSTIVDTFLAMEHLVDAGLVKSLGVSNFSADQVKQVYDAAKKYKPQVNQVESHPFFNQKPLEAAMAAAVGEGKIAITAYSPLNIHPDTKTRDLLTDATVVAIAKKHNVTPAQVVLAFQVVQGRAVIPRTSSLHRIQENFDCVKVKLDAEDLAKLLAFTPQERAVNPKNFNGLKGVSFFSD